MRVLHSAGYKYLHFVASLLEVPVFVSGWNGVVLISQLVIMVVTVLIILYFCLNRANNNNRVVS